MEKIKYPWSSQNINIRGRGGLSIEVYEPLIKHRWSFYARNPKVALQKLGQLPPATIHAILEYLYAGSPIARTNLPAFKACKIIDSHTQPNYHQDLIRLLQDTSTTDFAFYTKDPNDKIMVHRFFLYARSGFFRDLITQSPETKEYHETIMSHSALDMFIRYLYIGDLEVLDVTTLPELIGSGSRYHTRDPEEIDFLVVSSIQKHISPENAEQTRIKANSLGLQSIVDMIDSIISGHH